MYSETLLDHFNSPRNVGELADPDAEATAQNPVCGDDLRMQFRIQGGVIHEVRWSANGCPPVLAAASAVSEMIAGMSVEMAARLELDDVDRAVGGLPPRKHHAATLVVQVLRRALANIAPEK